MSSDGLRRWRRATPDAPPRRRQLLPTSTERAGHHQVTGPPGVLAQSVSPESLLDLLGGGAAGGGEARGLGLLSAGEPDLGDRGVVPARAGNVVLHGVLVALDQVVVVGSVRGALLQADRAGVLGLVSLVVLLGLGLLRGLVLVGDGLLGGLLGGGDRVVHDLLAGNRLQHQGDDRHGGVVALAGGRS